MGAARISSGASGASGAGEAGGPGRARGMGKPCAENWENVGRGSTSAAPTCRAPGSQTGVAAHTHSSFSLSLSCSWDWLWNGSHWSWPGQDGNHLFALPCGLKAHQGLLTGSDSRQAPGLGTPALSAPHILAAGPHSMSPLDHFYFSVPEPCNAFTSASAFLPLGPSPALWIAIWSQGQAPGGS